MAMAKIDLVKALDAGAKVECTVGNHNEYRYWVGNERVNANQVSRMVTDGTLVEVRRHYSNGCLTGIDFARPSKGKTS